MKPGRLPSIGITRSLRYYSPLRLLVSSVSDFGCPYTVPLRPSPAASEISRVTQRSFPLMPSRRPRKVHLLCSVSSADGCGLPHLTPRSALSMTSYEALWVPWWYGLRVCDPFSVKVFLIRLVLKVASHNRIFACGVYRKFPAPDSNRLTALLPRRTVRSCNDTSCPSAGTRPLPEPVVRFSIDLFCLTNSCCNNLSHSAYFLPASSTPYF
jgi:hypothetical protein